ncbi:HEAT repeat domain-containing protein [Paenibacillus sinopodophylli]|uniref:HEAT repeat domain-containing protein n=1 Tax=Paenibacillus sinopodophylli TaxID=1837342 RepID=UPI00110C9B2A|nr:HEAT repeat domain-containing protein [Paenibacillus sinopodophylli]
MQQNLKLMTDEQMIQFIREGYLILQNELPNELHQKVMDQIHTVLMEEGNPGNNILPRVPEIRSFFETPVVRGALTGILGPDYYMHPHRHCHYNQPANQNPGGGLWHKDGYWSAMRSHRPWWAMIFYYTQDVTEELGPTVIMPGSQYNESYPGDDKPFLLPTGPAGTMVLVHFDLWHKASLNTSSQDRFMLKFQFARLEAPTAPTWNCENKTFQVATGQADETLLPIWLDVWDWLNGGLAERTEPLDPKVDDHHESVRLAGLVEGDLENTALNAAYTLARLGEAGLRELLAILSQGSASASLRAAYGCISAGQRAVTGLIKLLDHPDSEKRSLACFALGMIGSPKEQVEQALIIALSDENIQVQRQAVEALGFIHSTSTGAVSATVQTLVRALSEEQLLQQNDYWPHQGYIANKVGYSAALSLLRTGKYGAAAEVIAALTTALDSKDRYVRAYAFEALTYLRTEEAVEVLLRYYRTARWCPDTSKASMF